MPEHSPPPVPVPSSSPRQQHALSYLRRPESRQDTGASVGQEAARGEAQKLGTRLPAAADASTQLSAALRVLLHVIARRTPTLPERARRRGHTHAEEQASRPETHPQPCRAFQAASWPCPGHANRQHSAPPSSARDMALPGLTRRHALTQRLLLDLPRPPGPPPPCLRPLAPGVCVAGVRRSGPRRARPGRGAGT